MTKPQTPSPKPKTSQKSDVKRSFWQRHRVASIVGIVFVVLYVVSLFVPFVYPYTRFPLYVVKCGGLPVIASDFAAGYTYDKPGGRHYQLDIFVTHFFCTPEEAESKSFHESFSNN